MKKTLIIAGGGTGGHIYPGVAIANALKKNNPNLEIIFVGTNSGLENKIVPKEGYKLELVSVGKLNRAGGVLTVLKTLIKLPWAFFQSLQIINKYKPVAVLGVGGYASGPMVMMASLAGYPTALWEANSHPGMTNRWLAKFVNKAYVVFEDAKIFFNKTDCHVFGLPVRSEIEKSKEVSETLGSTIFRVLVFGGSQGARALNNAVSDLILNGGIEGVQFTHQTGALDFQKIKEKYKGFEGKVSVHEFLYNMNEQYENSDLIVCRGGAGTIAELTAKGKVGIIVPLPTAADNHQLKNAESLVKQNAGILLEQKNLNPQSLKNEIIKLKNNRELLKQMSINAKKMFKPQAAEKIAEDLTRGL